MCLALLEKKTLKHNFVAGTAKGSRTVSPVRTSACSECQLQKNISVSSAYEPTTFLPGSFSKSELGMAMRLKLF
jgi:hypothetical protein